VGERTIGIFKKRFSCLNMDLQYQPIKVGNMIVACAVIHNIALENNEAEDYEPDPNQVPLYAAEVNPNGIQSRTQFINTYFQ